MTIDCDLPDFVIKGGLWNGYKLYDLYKEAETPCEWHKPLFEHAKKKGLSLFSTPFDKTAVDLVLSILHELGATQYRANEDSRDYTEAERHRFEQAGINVVYQQWEHPVYPQPQGPFLSHLAFPDPVCNLGLRKASALLGMEKNSAL